jgi:hypothetical protein
MRLIKKVKKEVGLNPVARAVAKAKLRSVVTTMRIKFFLLEDGDDCAQYALPVATQVYAMLGALEAIGETDSVDFRKLRSGAKVLLEISERQFRWRRRDVVTIDNALEICERRWPDIPPRVLNEQIQIYSSEG